MSALLPAARRKFLEAQICSVMNIRQDMTITRT
jgi:hypothetical protein